MTTNDMPITVKESTDISVETSMETQIEEKDTKINYKKIHITLILFISLQVLYLFTYSEPMSLFWGGEPLIPLYNDDIIDRSARIIMIYHSIATPFLVAVSFWTIEYFPVREKLVPSLKITLVPGAISTGISGLIFAYTRIRFFHEIFYLSLFLVFLGGVLYIVAAFPIPDKFPKESTEGTLFYGLNLEYYSLVILAACIIVSVIYAGLAGVETFTNTIWYLDRPHNDAFLAEEVVRVLIHDHPEEFVVSHLHIQLALTGAMLTMIGFKLSKIKGKIYHYILFANPIGIVTVSYGAWVLNHYLIWVGAGILILCTVVLSIKGLYEISKDSLGENFESASNWEKLKKTTSDPILFTLYFIFLYAQIVVTICGIIVGLKTREVYRLHEWVDIEYDFNVGHWHLLAVLLVALTMLIAINYFNVPEKSKKISGWLLFIGSFIAFTAANIYMMRTPDWNKMWSMYLTFVGVWFLTLGMGAGIYQIVKAYRNQKKLEQE